MIRQRQQQLTVVGASGQGVLAELGCFRTFPMLWVSGVSVGDCIGLGLADTDHAAVLGQYLVTFYTVGCLDDTHARSNRKLWIILVVALNALHHLLDLDTISS